MNNVPVPTFAIHRNKYGGGPSEFIGFDLTPVDINSRLGLMLGTREPRTGITRIGSWVGGPYRETITASDDEAAVWIAREALPSLRSALAALDSVAGEAPPPATCQNNLPCNRGVPNSDYLETCGYELCPHGQCSRCDQPCRECPQKTEPAAAQTGADDDIAF